MAEAPFNETVSETAGRFLVVAATAVATAASFNVCRRSIGSTKVYKRELELHLLKC